MEKIFTVVEKEEEENILIRPMMPRKYTEKQREELRKFEKELLNNKSRENRQYVKKLTKF